MSIQIGPLSPSDRRGLEAALRSDDTFTANEIAVALELIDDAIDNDKSDYWVRVARDDADAEIAGYICFGPTPMTKSTYDLYWIVSHTNHRGKGVAGTLIRAMETELKGLSATAIRVETSQTEGYGAARTLYAKYDYPETARFKDFYRPGDDLIVYYKRL